MPSAADPLALRIPFWTRELTKIASQPLALRPDFPQVAQRWENWWRRTNRRPLIIPVSQNTASPMIHPVFSPWDKCFDKLSQPAEWVACRDWQTDQFAYLGDALPSQRVDIGPVAIAAFLGAPMEVAQETQTTWHHPIIEDWDRLPDLVIDPSAGWLKVVLDLCRQLGEQAAGRYLICTPDLSGPADILANLRGPERLCLDLLENPEAVKDLSARLVDAWADTYALIYDTILATGAGVCQWVSCWSSRPHTIPTCDFNALIGPAAFNEFCLPYYEAQANRLGRACFHLDGPDAARHGPALSRSRIPAIQYTPGAGTPSALAKLDLFRMFQEAGQPIFIEAPFAEAERLCEELDPRGLAIRFFDAGPLSNITQLLDRLARRFPE